MSADRNADSPNPHKSLDLLIADALDRFDQGDVEGSVALLSRAAASDPENVVARRCLDVAQTSLELILGGHHLAAGRVDLRSVAAKAMAHQLRGGTLSNFEAVGDGPIDIGDPLDSTYDTHYEKPQTSEMFDPDAHRTAEIDLMAFDKGQGRTQELQLMTGFSSNNPKTKALAAALGVFDDDGDDLDIDVDVELDDFGSATRSGDIFLDDLDTTLRDALKPDIESILASPPTVGAAVSGKFQPLRLAPRPPRRNISDEELEHKLKTARPQPPPTSTGVVRYQGKAPPPPKHRRGPVRHTQAAANAGNFPDDDMRAYRSGVFSMPLRSSSSVPAVPSGSGEIALTDDLDILGGGEMHTDLTAIFESDNPLAFGVELSEEDVQPTSLVEGFDPWADLEEGAELNFTSVAEDVREHLTHSLPEQDHSFSPDDFFDQIIADDAQSWSVSSNDVKQRNHVTPEPGLPETEVYVEFATTAAMPPTGPTPKHEWDPARTSPLTEYEDVVSVAEFSEEISGDSGDAFVMEFGEEVSVSIDEEPNFVAEEEEEEEEVKRVPPPHAESARSRPHRSGISKRTNRSSPQNVSRPSRRSQPRGSAALAMSRPRRRGAKKQNQPAPQPQPAPQTPERSGGSLFSSSSHSSFEGGGQIEAMIAEAWELHQNEKFPEAQRLIKEIIKLEPNNNDAQFLTEQNQISLEKHYLDYLGDMELIARLALSPNELMGLRLDSRAGYLMSQVDGNMTLNDLLSICPMPRLEALETLAQFLDRGIIVLV